VPPGRAPTGTDLAEFAGMYYSDELEATWTLAAAAGAVVQVLHDPPTDLVIVKPGCS